jgi:hypothetical protein
MLWTEASVVPSAILPDERRPRRQIRGGINQAFCGLGIQSPRQHHPRRSGARRGPQRSGDGVVRVEGTAASRLGGRAGRRRRSTSGATHRVQPVCPIVRAEPVSDGRSACTGLRRLILITEVSAACGRAGFTLSTRHDGTAAWYCQQPRSAPGLRNSGSDLGFAVAHAHLILTERMAVLASPQPARCKAAGLVLGHEWAGMR